MGKRRQVSKNTQAIGKRQIKRRIARRLLVGYTPLEAFALYAFLFDVYEASERYNAMMKNKRHLTEGNIIHLIHYNADIIRKSLKIKIRVGEQDVLICENEIIHLHLKLLKVPHEYKISNGAAHELSKIL